MKPTTIIFVLLIVVALLYFLLKTQVETLFKQLATRVTAGAGQQQATQTQNNAEGSGQTLPGNNANDLNCPIQDVNFNKPLFKNMPKNKEVSFLQCFLNLHGAKLAVDGVYGNKTEAAVAARLGIALPVPPITLQFIVGITK